MKKRKGAPSSSKLSKKIKPSDAFQDASEEDINKEVDRINLEIKRLKEHRDELLIIKRMRPQTVAYYSVQVSQSSIKDDPSREYIKLQKIDTDPMSIVLEFAFKDQVLELGEFKKLACLCRAIWESIYHVPFILSLTKEVKSFDMNNMTKLTKLKGVEIAWFQKNAKLLEKLVQLNGNSIHSLVVRYDHNDNVGVTIPRTFANSFKSLKYVDSLTKKKKKFDFSKSDSVENLCLILHSTGRDYHEKMFPVLPPNLRKLCVLRSNIDQYFEFPKIMHYEHLTIIEPFCTFATNTIRRNLFTHYYLPPSNVKTFTLIRLPAGQKKPDPLATLVAIHEIIAKDATDTYNVVASATYKINMMSLAEIAHKHLEITFEEDPAIPGMPTTKYIDAHFKVFKNFLPDLVYSYDAQYAMERY